MFTFHHPRPVVDRKPVSELSVRHVVSDPPTLVVTGLVIPVDEAAEAAGRPIGPVQGIEDPSAGTGSTPP